MDDVISIIIVILLCGSIKPEHIS